MISYAPDPGNDLPALLDLLTVAVTTLDAVGVERYKDLRLHVIGVTGRHASRELTVAGGRLILDAQQDEPVGSPSLANLDRRRRARLVAELEYIMPVWNWSVGTMSAYLGWAEETLQDWMDLNPSSDTPPLSSGVADKVTRLLAIDQLRCFAGVPDEKVSAWLSRPRPELEGSSIAAILLTANGPAFTRLLLWAVQLVADAQIH